MTNESEDEHGEFGGELLPACDSSVKEKKIYWSTQFAKTFVSKLCKYKIIKLKNYLYLWHSCKKKKYCLFMLSTTKQRHVRVCVI